MCKLYCLILAGLHYSVDHFIGPFICIISPGGLARLAYRAMRLSG